MATLFRERPKSPRLPPDAGPSPAGNLSAIRSRAEAFHQATDIVVDGAISHNSQLYNDAAQQSSAQ